jgi:pimeloyl-ACP methyl ester carboxylesterase
VKRFPGTRARWRVIGGLIAGLLALTAPIAAGSQAPPDSVFLRVSDGTGHTFVCLSGLLGGTGGFARLERELTAKGHRVIRIDPFAHSVDSADVTFAALARRVDAILTRLRVDSAVVIGHSHGAGVALRLAASTPDRVTALWLMDAGALASSRTRVFSSSLRLIPLIARLPGGKGFIQRRIVRGLRENSGRHDWLDTATIRAYAAPLVQNVGRSVGLARRLAEATEPTPVTELVGRIRVPVSLVLGSAPHPSAPNAAELDALRSLGGLVRTTRLAGVGHFPHEEATREVAALILAGR